jgi:hypothetical protein
MAKNPEKWISDIGYWDLIFIWNLVLEICNLSLFCHYFQWINDLCVFSSHPTNSLSTIPVKQPMAPAAFLNSLTSTG